MTLRRAKIVMATSILLLAWVVLRLSSGAGDGRADLVGAPVTVAPSTTAVPSPRVVRPVTTTTTAPDPVGFPQRLKIPALGVDAPVVAVGLESDGSMEIPGASEAGWYWPGPRPGSDNGSAVIAAHVDYGGVRGVFFDLRTLGVGSEVAVVDDEGREHRYEVTERSQYVKDALPIPELFRTGELPVLTLITCGGAFDRVARSYTDNIVVRAVPV